MPIVRFRDTKNAPMAALISGNVLRKENKTTFGLRAAPAVKIGTSAKDAAEY